MASRNLSYLGNPYQEGFGKAAIIPTGQSSQQFINEMGKIKEQQRADAAAKAAAKAAEKKSLDDFKVDYFIGHQGYFQDRVKDLQSRWVDLMANNESLGNANNPLSAQLQKDMYAIKNDAALSKQIEGFYDQISKMTPEQKAKVSSKSLNELMDFYALPFGQQIEGWKNGTAPKLVTKVEIPNAAIDVVLNNYIPKKDEIFGYSDEEREKEWEGRFMNADRELRTLITEDMFMDEPDPKKAREDFIASKVGSVRALYDDRKGAAELAQKEKEQKFKEEMERKKLSIAQQRLALDKFKTYSSVKPRVKNDLNNYVQSLVDEDVASLTFAKDLMAVEIRDKDGKVISVAKPNIYIDKVSTSRATAGAGESRDGGKFMVIEYPPNAKIPPTRIRIKDEEGNITDDGYKMLYGTIQAPYLEFSKEYGVATGDDMGQGIGTLDDGSEEGTMYESRQKNTSGSKFVGVPQGGF